MIQDMIPEEILNAFPLPEANEKFEKELISTIYALGTKYKKDINFFTMMLAINDKNEETVWGISDGKIKDITPFQACYMQAKYLSIYKILKEMALDKIKTVLISLPKKP